MFWRQQDFEGIPTSTISWKIWKNEIQEEGLKKHDLLIDFWCQHGRPETVTKRFPHYTCSNLGYLGGQEKLLKMEVQTASKRHQNWSLWRPRYDFLIFWWILASLFFRCFWGLAKGEPNKIQKQIWGENTNPGTSKNRTLSLSRLDNLAQVLAILADTTCVGLTTPDTGQCRWILAPTGFWGPQTDHFCINST